MNDKRLVAAALAVLGVIFLALAVYYWMTPAGSLPHFMPGYLAGDTAKHFKHGLAAVILAAGCGVLAWFMTGKKKAPSVPTGSQTQ